MGWIAFPATIEKVEYFWSVMDTAEYKSPFVYVAWVLDEHAKRYGRLWDPKGILALIEAGF